MSQLGALAARPPRGGLALWCSLLPSYLILFLAGRAYTFDRAMPAAAAAWAANVAFLMLSAMLWISTRARLREVEE